MSRDSNLQSAGDSHQHNSGTGEASGGAVHGASVAGSTLPMVGKMPPVHWSFWSYLWRYGLLIPLPGSVMGMFIGYMDSTGYSLHTGPEMVGNIAVFGLVFGGLSQIVAFVVALTLFVVATPARRQWAVFRDAGWTTTQCRAAYLRQKQEAAAVKLTARLRELGLAPVQPQATLAPPAPPAPRKKLSKMDRFWAWLAIPMLAVFVFVLVGPWLDTRDVQTLQCEVVSAEPRTSSGGTRGSASTASVLVKTSNCGMLGISRGVTFDNREEVALSFKVGATYGFDVGWYSRTFFKNEIQSVRAYRLIASGADGNV